MTTTALFRADAGPEIGSGHVLRSLVLANEWVDSGGQAVMLGTVPDGLHERITEMGVELVQASNSDTLDGDASETIELALARKAEWVVVDGYKFGVPYVNQLRASTLKVLQFSDGQLMEPIAADIVLDQNLGAENRNYELTTVGAKALLGIKYVSLGQQFRSLIVQKKQIAERATKLMVTFGGSDPDNYTGTVVEALIDMGEIESTIVVLGVSNQHSPAIIERCQDAPRFRCVSNVANMAELMTEADIAIAAAGSTSWELAALGVPSILVTTADNQEQIAIEMASHGVAMSVGWIDAGNVNSINKAIKTLADDRERRSEMSQAGQALVDGKGAGRVVDAMRTYVPTAPNSI